MSFGAAILIRTKNEAEHLGRTLEAVLDQSLPPKEVLVIDSGSTDGTLEVAREYPVRVATIDPHEWSYPRALNLGASLTAGDVIVSLSAHCVPTSAAWLDHLTKHFSDPVVAGVWGPNVRPGATPEPEPPQRQKPGTYTYETRMWGLSNANAAIRRELWELFPFDERLPATEDKAWGLEAMTRGYDLVYEPAAGVWHETHPVASAYRRNRAVVEGFNLIFPEYREHSSGTLAVLGRAAWRTASQRVREPSMRGMARDLKRGVSAVSALIGGYVADRTRKD